MIKGSGWLSDDCKGNWGTNHLNPTPETGLYLRIVPEWLFVKK